jgi:phosphoribosylformylglycinamidine (FGAM) synthase-like enzyme
VGEITEPEGALIDTRKMPVGGGPSMSILGLWTAEFQEINALLLKPQHEALFGKICQRERVPSAVAGGITGDGKMWSRTAVTIPLRLIGPTTRFWVRRHRRHSR